MSQVGLNPIAAQFGQLAERFEDYARRAEKPSHLLADVEQTAVRAGRLLQDAADAGAFAGDAWWRDGKAPLGAWAFDSDAERFRLLWTFAIGSWLVKRYPSRFRHGAGGWDWSCIATDEDGRPLDKDRRPIRGRWHRNGEPLPDDWQGNPFDPGFWETHKGERYEWRLDGEPAKQEGFYDESDALAHPRIRAEVYADACRLLAELIGRRPRAGEALMRLAETDPRTREALQRVQARMQALAAVLQTPEFQRELERARHEQREAWERVAEEIRARLRAAGNELTARRFEAPKTLEDWERLARIVEMPFETIRAGDYTLRDVYEIALAWADRQRLRAQLTQSGESAPWKPTRSADGSGVRNLAGQTSQATASQTREDRPDIHPATLAKAILFEEANIPATELARRVGVSAGTLYKKSGPWKDVRALLMARKDKPSARGFKDDEGNLDAYEPDSGQDDD